MKTRSNLWLVAGVLVVFLAMGLSLLSFLLEQRERRGAGDYRGLEEVLERGDELEAEVSPVAGNPGRGGLRPRALGRPEGALADPAHTD